MKFATDQLATSLAAVYIKIMIHARLLYGLHHGDVINKFKSRNISSKVIYKCKEHIYGPMQPRSLRHAAVAITPMRNEAANFNALHSVR